jgi:hypothetical protein
MRQSPSNLPFDTIHQTRRGAQLRTGTIELSRAVFVHYSAAPMIYFKPIVYALVCSLIPLGCASDGFVLKGARTMRFATKAIPFSTDLKGSLGARALEKPMIGVLGRELISSAYRFATVVSLGDSYDRSQRRVIFRLANKKLVQIDYTPPGGQLLPLGKGAQVTLRLFSTDGTTNSTDPGEDPIMDSGRRAFTIATQRRASSPDLRLGAIQGWVLVIRTPKGQLVAAIFSAQPARLTPGASSGWNENMAHPIVIAPSRKTVYREAYTLPNLCEPVVFHMAATVTTKEGKAASTVYPGTYRRVTAGGYGYRVILLDAAESPDNSCPDETPLHFSGAILAARSEK